MNMRSLLTLIALSGLASALAQTWETQGDNTYTLKRCYPSSGAIRCDFTFAHTTDAPGLLNIGTPSFSVVTSDGTRVEASKIAAGGAGFTEGGFQLQAYKGAPLQVSALFNVPAATTIFPVMVLEGVPLNNVRVMGAAPVVPAATAAPTSSSAYTAVLTNCKTGTGGVLTCVATLTPRR